MVNSLLHMVTYIESCNPNSNDGYVAYVPFELPVDKFVPCNKMVKMGLEYEFYHDKEYKEYQISKIQNLYANIFLTALYFDLPTEGDASISYCYTWYDSEDDEDDCTTQIGISSKDLNIIYKRLEEIRQKIKAKGGIIYNENTKINIQPFWYDILEEHAYRIIKEWFLEIRYNPEYKYCRDVLNSEYNNFYKMSFSN